jgi:4'-phosphopantetheinyl transferase
MADQSIQEVGHDLPAELEIWWLDLDATHTFPGGSADTGASVPVPVRRRNVANEALLDLLSRRLGCPADELAVVTAPGGKPRLRGTPLAFNLSHAGGEGLIGIGVGIEIGVDLEVFRPVPESEAFAREYLAVSELDTWIRLPVVERDRWLLECWTRKEACLKARGVGLGLAPASIPAGAGPEMKRISLGGGKADHTLFVTSLELPSGSPGAAAVVVEGP